MKFNLSGVGAAELRIDSDLDTRGKPTRKATRLHAHPEYFASQDGKFNAGGFAAVLAGRRATTAATPPVPLARSAAELAELAPETIERTAKRIGAEQRPRELHAPQGFEVERTVGGARPGGDRDERRRRPTPFAPEQQPEAEKKPVGRRFELGAAPAPLAAAPPEAASSDAELAEWERALSLEAERAPGTLPLLSRAENEQPIEPVLLSGRGPQRGALPTIRRAALPEPRVPASRKAILGAGKPAQKRVFATAVVQGGPPDPRQSRPTAMGRLTTGGHAGRV